MISSGAWLAAGGFGGEGDFKGGFLTFTALSFDNRVLTGRIQDDGARLFTDRPLTADGRPFSFRHSIGEFPTSAVFVLDGQQFRTGQVDPITVFFPRFQLEGTATAPSLSTNFPTVEGVASLRGGVLLCDPASTSTFPQGCPPGASVTGVGRATLDLNLTNGVGPFYEANRLSVTFVPEPGTLLLFSGGLVGIAGWRLRTTSLFGIEKAKA